MTYKNTNKIQTITNILKEKLSQVYKNKLDQLILFGSQARGDARKNSDIDILVVLKDEINPVKEIKRNNDLISEICLEYDEDINCFYIGTKELENPDNLLLKNINKEGIIL
jgi:predicted nucleotidyltransferase